ncbi:MAG: 1-acyl-sn-glycerol-3-phosphate acyltransferase [Lachnospiraceae bacterium]|nr:1-acyl-sn-glycerol-3-phosphate acyltransferase [Lachnospiraceae bacterium]
MLRFLAILIFLILFLVLTIPIMVVEWVINKFNPGLRRKTSNAIVKWGLGVCVFLAGTKITTIGIENIPKDRAVLYVGNHRSYFDILLLAMHAPGPISFLAKKEMLRYPLLCHWMMLIDSTFIDRSDIKQGLKVILKNIELLKEGVSVSVFPEGTRNKTDEILLPFHDGSFKMAEKSKCPIVIVTYNNTRNIFEAHMPRVEKQHIIMEFSKPFYMSDLSPEDRRHIGKYVSNILIETHEKNKELV